MNMQPRLVSGFGASASVPRGRGRVPLGTMVDVYVRYLRDTIDRRFGVTRLEGVRRAGYRLPD
jgi:DNA-binding response OmpR family regulator